MDLTDIQTASSSQRDMYFKSENQTRVATNSLHETALVHGPINLVSYCTGLKFAK